MRTQNNKHINTNEIVWIRQLLFAYDTFLSSSKPSFEFHISSSHSNTNLPIRRVSQEQFLIFTYSSYSPIYILYIHNLTC